MNKFEDLRAALTKVSNDLCFSLRTLASVIEAGTGDTAPETLFPWKQCSSRVRMARLRAIWRDRLNDAHTSTCESMCRYGRTNIMTWRLVGKVTIGEIDETMAKLGFAEKWMNT